MSNPMELLQCAEIRLIVRLPGSFKVFEIPIVLGEDFAQALHPLPRDRELPWMPLEQRKAREMERLRNIVAENVAVRLASELANVFVTRDPINGYSPEEWAAITNQPTRSTRKG